MALILAIYLLAAPSGYMAGLRFAKAQNFEDDGTATLVAVACAACPPLSAVVALLEILKTENEQ